MFQGYNYYQQQMPILLKGRPVSSIEEARAANIDFDGSIFYFPDIANKRIYTKKINTDGTSSLLLYQLTDIPTDKPSTDYVTREEFENFVRSLNSKTETKTIF